MKTKIHFYILSSVLLALISVTSCDKDIEFSEKLTPQSATNLDTDAATWSPILMTSADQIPVPAPTDVSSDAYKAELAAIKDAQSKLNKGQQGIIEFWSGGGVLRWNQIFRGLVARYNLPPAPRADGTYPVPDAENPFSDPMFPFANPPYAARAYSYAANPIYDGLKAAWHFKYLYNRKAPYEYDSDIAALMPKSDLPAYPSEEAVMSGAAVEMLKLLFPASVEEITKHAADQRNAALWSGKATASDIAAGLALGKAVANLYIARARTDGMGAAGGNRAIWEALKLNATNRGDEPWVSLETPPRPPMLPVFGKVLPWKMTTDEIVAIRPPAPPLRGSAEMDAECAEVQYYSDNITRERLAIVHKWADGAGTYTPPGHWNDIAAEHIRDANFSEVRAARAFALLNLTMHNSSVACWDTKFFYFNARPSQLLRSIKTQTGVPNFPAYVSGHSTYSASAAGILSYLFPAYANDFQGMASEAGASRLYGGIHYRRDSEAGLTLGYKVSEHIINTFASVDGADD